MGFGVAMEGWGHWEQLTREEFPKSPPLLREHVELLKASSGQSQAACPRGGAQARPSARSPQHPGSGSRCQRGGSGLRLQTWDRLPAAITSKDRSSSGKPRCVLIAVECVFDGTSLPGARMEGRHLGAMRPTPCSAPQSAVPPRLQDATSRAAPGRPRPPCLSWQPCQDCDSPHWATSPCKVERRAPSARRGRGCAPGGAWSSQEGEPR